MHVQEACGRPKSDPASLTPGCKCVPSWQGCWSLPCVIDRDRVVSQILPMLFKCFASRVLCHATQFTWSLDFPVFPRSRNAFTPYSARSHVYPVVYFVQCKNSRHVASLLTAVCSALENSKFTPTISALGFSSVSSAWVVKHLAGRCCWFLLIGVTTVHLSPTPWVFVCLPVCFVFSVPSD